MSLVVNIKSIYITAVEVLFRLWPEGEGGMVDEEVEGNVKGRRRRGREWVK